MPRLNKEGVAILKFDGLLVRVMPHKLQLHNEMTLILSGSFHLQQIKLEYWSNFTI